MSQNEKRETRQQKVRPAKINVEEARVKALITTSEQPRQKAPCGTEERERERGGERDDHARLRSQTAKWITAVT